MMRRRAFVRIVVLSAFDRGIPTRRATCRSPRLRLFGEGSPGRPTRRASPIQNWEQKAMHRSLHFSAPDTAPLFDELPATPGEEDTRSRRRGGPDGEARPRTGVLRWDVPEGNWQILRFGCTIGDHSRVSTCSDGWQGYALDVLDAGAFERYWDAVVEPLIADAGPLAGTHAQVSAHRQLGGRGRQLDADAARGVPQAPRLRPASVPAGAGGPDRGLPPGQQPLPARLPQDARRPGG